MTSKERRQLEKIIPAPSPLKGTPQQREATNLIFGSSLETGQERIGQGKNETIGSLKSARGRALIDLFPFTSLNREKGREGGIPRNTLLRKEKKGPLEVEVENNARVKRMGNEMEILSRLEKEHSFTMFKLF